MFERMRSDCPISTALDLVGDKWTLLVIRDMIFDHKRFYKEFLSSKEGMATNILSDRLKRLEAHGLIESKVFEALKTRKEYALTQKGMDLIPVLIEIIVWSAKYHEDLAVPPEFLEQVATDRDGVTRNIMSAIA